MSRPEYGSDLHLWNQPEATTGTTDCPTCGYPFAAMSGSITEPIEHDCEPWSPTKTWVYKPEAVARSTDPGTSWEAARSITPEKLRKDQAAVLHAIKRWGPLTDEALDAHFSRFRTTPPSPDFRTLSPSGVRTRRSELVSMGLVRDSGRKDTLRSGRKAIVWEAVP